MQANISQSQANSLLEQAFKDASSASYEPSSDFSKEIKTVIEGPHLTFRYILVTALLAKAVNSKAHPLSLQAGADLEGAYDARSVCHEVLVPFERKYLSNGLGGSNEPFLNKPARYKALDATNAVRRGKDLEILKLLCRTLPQIATSADAKKCLTDALHFALLRAKTNSVSENLEIMGGGGRLSILDFIIQFVFESLEGETCALAVGALIECQYKQISDKIEVTVHPVNQSGASSNEVSDIDVRSGGKLLATIEVKDKAFTLADVGHAVRKVKASNFDSLMFVYGPRATPSPALLLQALTDAAKEGIHVAFVPVADLAKIILGCLGAWSEAEFFASLQKHAKQARVKDSTKARIEATAAALEWIEAS